MFLLWNYAILFLDFYHICVFHLPIAEDMAKAEEMANSNRAVVILNSQVDLEPGRGAPD